MTTCNYFQWNQPSTEKMYYSVCDIQTFNKPSNWLRSDFIGLKDAQLLDIEIGYRLVNCPHDAGPHCKTSLGFYVYHSDRKLSSAPDPTSGSYEFVEDIVPTDTLPDPEEGKEYVYHGKIPTKARGVYLGFLDTGTCISLKNVTVGYKFCSERGGELVKFPRTVAPANDSFAEKKAGKCSDKNSVSEKKLTGMCISSGKWNITDGLKCFCRKGYQIVEPVPNSLECKGVHLFVIVGSWPSKEHVSCNFF